MMSLPLIRSEIARFLAGTEPEVLCIRGRWGVGKTFAWRRLLKEAEQAGAIGCPKYAYVSLFGRNSLSDLRNSIFESTRSSKDVEATHVADLSDASSRWRWGIRQARQAPGLLPPSSSYTLLAQRISYLSVKDTIVCLDDLERACSGLDLKDVLGLASQLKDEKKSKVVLLLNAEKLEADSKDDFANQLEKVVDVAIDFEVSPEEAAEIALDPEMPFYGQLWAKCVTLEIDNIRVIRKAERFCARLQPLLAEFHPRVFDKAIHTATIACFAKFQPGLAPSLDTLRSFDILRVMRPSAGDDPDPHSELLARYGFLNIDDSDRAIIGAVERGFFDEAQLQAQAARTDVALRSGDMESDYGRAWEIFRSSFADNEDELVNALRNAVVQNIDIIDPAKLDGIVSTLRDLGHEDTASELIAFFKDQKAGEGAGFWDLNSFQYIGGIKDAELRAAMRERHRATEAPVDPAAILKQIGVQAGWDPEAAAILGRLSADEIVRILRAAHGDDFSLIIGAMKRILSIGNLPRSLEEFCREAKAALGQIAGMSRLNALRVEVTFGEIGPDR